MALSTLGLNGTFVDAEFELMESIVNGNGFSDHHEDRYYNAIEKAFAELEKAKSIRKG